MYPGSDDRDLMGSKQADGGRPVSTKEVGWKRSSITLARDRETSAGC